MTIERTSRERMARRHRAGKTPVTVLGLGLMGQALAGAFLRGGHPTTVWNRTAARAEQLVTEGAKGAVTAGHAIAASPLVIVCLSDYDAVHEVLDLQHDALQDRVLVNLTTGTSAQARQTAEWATQRNIDYLEGVIMAMPPDIATDAAVLLYSGPKSVFDTHEATLRKLGAAGTIYLGDDHGLSSLYDMALLNFLWGNLNAFLHGAALLETAGVKAVTFAPLANRLINLVTTYVTAYASQVDVGKYPGDDATMTVHRAGIQHLIEESEQLGINAEVPRLFKALADRAVTDGHADSSYAAMIEQFRKQSPAPRA